MSHDPINEFTPDYRVPPGDILAETLVAKGMLPAELAMQVDVPVKLIRHIIAGKAPITPCIAGALERALGVSAALWNNLERQDRT